MGKSRYYIKCGGRPTRKPPWKKAMTMKRTKRHTVTLIISPATDSNHNLLNTTTTICLATWQTRHTVITHTPHPQQKNTFHDRESRNSQYRILKIYHVTHTLTRDKTQDNPCTHIHRETHPHSQTRTHSSKYRRSIAHRRQNKFSRMGAAQTYATPHGIVNRQISLPTKKPTTTDESETSYSPHGRRPWGDNTTPTNNTKESIDHEERRPTQGSNIPNGNRYQQRTAPTQPKSEILSHLFPRTAYYATQPIPNTSEGFSNTYQFPQKLTPVQATRCTVTGSTNDTYRNISEGDHKLDLQNNISTTPRPKEGMMATTITPLASPNISIRPMATPAQTHPHTGNTKFRLNRHKHKFETSASHYFDNTDYTPYILRESDDDPHIEDMLGTTPPQSQRLEQKPKFTSEPQLEILNTTMKFSKEQQSASSRPTNQTSPTIIIPQIANRRSAQSLSREIPPPTPAPPPPTQHPPQHVHAHQHQPIYRDRTHGIRYDSHHSGPTQQEHSDSRYHGNDRDGTYPAPQYHNDYHDRTCSFPWKLDKHPACHESHRQL